MILGLLETWQVLVGKPVQIPGQMEYLFNSGKPHFMVWLIIYNIDTKPCSKVVQKLIEYNANIHAEDETDYLVEPLLVDN